MQASVQRRCSPSAREWIRQIRSRRGELHHLPGVRSVSHSASRKGGRKAKQYMHRLPAPVARPLHARQCTFCTSAFDCGADARRPRKMPPHAGGASQAMQDPEGCPRECPRDSPHGVRGYRAGRCRGGGAALRGHGCATQHPKGAGASHCQPFSTATGLH